MGVSRALGHWFLWFVGVMFVAAVVTRSNVGWFLALVLLVPPFLALWTLEKTRPAYERRQREMQQEHQARLEDIARERRIRESREIAIEALWSLSPIEFEKAVERVFQKQGYSTSLTPLTGDYGADIIAEKDGLRTIVEVKQQRSPIGVQVIQRAIGARRYHGAVQAVVVSLGGFTAQAQRAAMQDPISLWDQGTLAGELTEQDLFEILGREVLPISRPRNSVTYEAIHPNKPVGRGILTNEIRCLRCRVGWHRIGDGVVEQCSNCGAAPVDLS